MEEKQSLALRHEAEITSLKLQLDRCVCVCVCVCGVCVCVVGVCVRACVYGMPFVTKSEAYNTRF